MSATDYLENKKLDHVLGGGDYTRPATVYIGLSLADPGETGAGLVEPSGGAYARVAVTNNATNWPAASGGSKSNGAAFTFASPTGSWGTVTHWFIADAPSSGNMLYKGPLTAAVSIGAGDPQPRFAAGTLIINED